MRNSGGAVLGPVHIRAPRERDDVRFVDPHLLFVDVQRIPDFEAHVRIDGEIRGVVNPAAHRLGKRGDWEAAERQIGGRQGRGQLEQEHVPVQQLHRAGRIVLRDDVAVRRHGQNLVKVLRREELQAERVDV